MRDAQCISVLVQVVALGVILVAPALTESEVGVEVVG